MTALPKPLVLAEVDVRSFGYMPLDVVRLLKSDTWRDGNSDQRAACIALWCESWSEVPAGSLPDNDRILAKLADVPNWKKVRDYVLKGWVKCSDGRFYHPVVCEKALEAWARKKKRSDAGKAGNDARWSSQSDKPDIAIGSQSDRIAIPTGQPAESQQNGTERNGTERIEAQRFARVATVEDVHAACAAAKVHAGANDFRTLNRLFAAGLDMPEICQALATKRKNMEATPESLSYFEKFFRDYLAEKPPLPAKTGAKPKPQLADVIAADREAGHA